jgi:hypothetical protein
MFESDLGWDKKVLVSATYDSKNQDGVVDLLGKLIIYISIPQLTLLRYSPDFT